ncbi:hypothetical protein BCY88_16175 [Paraburkholderia fungorum]|uniref:Uncharacterized protein n=1 Tax=Paraburkholderia fungorum TaxID=134537 RepID=A0A420GWX6_9BURK|nr:hypothetical protein BCY88_16175 [Paraburkholderia fungorum]
MVVVVVVITALGDDNATAQCAAEGDSQQDQRENSFHDVVLPFTYERTLLSDWITDVFVCNRTCRFLRLPAAFTTGCGDRVQHGDRPF